MQLDERRLDHAVDAYKAAFDGYMREWTAAPDKDASRHPGRDATKAGIKAVLSTLQGAEQKPVAWLVRGPKDEGWWLTTEPSVTEQYEREIGQEAVRPLFAAPVALPDRDRVLEEAELAVRNSLDPSRFVMTGPAGIIAQAVAAIRAIKSAERQP